MEYSTDNNRKNRGNFLALLDFNAEGGDEIIAKLLGEWARNATYTSPTIQNDIIAITMEYLRNQIISEIQSMHLSSRFSPMKQLMFRILNSFAHQFDLSMKLVVYMKNFLDL